MALIGKIQKNSLLLVIIVGVALLAFIFTDLINMGDDETEILPLGTVWGQPVDEEEYYTLIDQYTERDKAAMEQQGREWDETMDKDAQNQAFNETIRRVLMNTEFDKIGLTCTVDELNDMIHGNHIHPWVMQIQMFQNRMTGAFERDSVRNFIDKLEDEPSDEEQRKNWLEARKQWKQFENELKDNRKAEKYVVLIKRGMYSNSLEVADYYKNENEKRNISFVIQRFTDIEADEFEVTDEEIRAYFDEHKNDPEYEQENEARDIDFVSFPIVATESDQLLIADQLENVKSAWALNSNNRAFVEQHSSSDFYEDTLSFRSGPSFIFDPRFGNCAYPETLDERVQSAKVGDIVGPVAYIDQMDKNKNKVAIAKVTGTKTELQAWVRHILIKTDETQPADVAKAKADSIIKVITAKQNFVEMVTKHSDDPGSIDKGGEYKWFAQDRMVKEFNDASFKGQIGKLQLVKTTYGYHIVEVLGRAERIVPALAVITKEVIPSENSIKEMEERVYDYIFAINKSKEDSAFFRMAEDSAVSVQNQRIWMEQDFVMGVSKPDEIMRFAFAINGKQGEISDPIFDSDKYVVAMRANIIEEGVPEFEDVKEAMKMPALREKQAKFWIEKMSGKTSIDEVAKVIKNGVVMDAEIIFGSNAIQGGGGNEPEVIGHLFTKIPEGSMTKPIEGNSGIYVAVIRSIKPAPEISDDSVARETFSLNRTNDADGGVMQALREKADVVDNRRRKEIQRR